MTAGRRSRLLIAFLINAVLVLCIGWQASSAARASANSLALEGASPQASDLIAHWALDEGSGTQASDSAGGNHATIAAGATWTTGRFDSGVQFDGTRGHLALAAPLDVGGSGITIAAWVRHTSLPTTADQRIVSKAGGTAEQDHYWMLSHTVTGGQHRLRFRLKAGGATTTLVAPSGNLASGAWYHAAATYDGATMRIFLNGAEVGRANKSGSIAQGASVPVNIGRSPDGSNYLHGAIDDVRVYARGLSAAEITATMNTGGSSAADTIAPSAPSGLQGSATSATEARLTWTASTDNVGVTGYRVRRGGTAVASTAGTSYTDSGLAAGSTYTFTVAAFDAAGNESPQSSAAMVTTVSADTGAPIISAVGAASVTASSATITWTTEEPADSRVEYGSTSSYGSLASATGLTTSHAVTVPGLQPASTYHYRVVSGDAAGNTARSGDFTFTTAANGSGSGDSDLVGHWSLDDQTGTAATDSAGGMTGTLTNGATWSSGRVGGGVRFDGADDYIALPAFDVAGNGMTIALWVNSSAFPPRVEQRFVAKSTGTDEQAHFWMVGQTMVGASSRLRFRLRTEDGTTTTLVATSGDLPLNSWYHAAAIYDGSAMRLYLNGVEVGRANKTGPVASDASVPVNIGRSPDGSNYLSGLVDDVRVYSRPLTQGEISVQVGSTSNQPPAVTLTNPSNGATFPAPAAVALTASASDPENRLASVQFFGSGTLVGTASSAPYTASWTAVPAGSYTLTAVARDADGGSTTSTPVAITVTGGSASLPWRVAFTASADHDSNVTSYLLEIFASSSDPNSDAPVSASDLGKPTPGTNREIVVDRTTLFEALTPGNYLMTVRAIGPGGTALSSAFALAR
jgi:chitodextrinase